jgi:hypothetical protein
MCIVVYYAYVLGIIDLSRATERGQMAKQQQKQKTKQKAKNKQPKPEKMSKVRIWCVERTCELN